MSQASPVAEVQELLTRGLATGPTASRAVGYAETNRHLNGEFDAQATQDLIAQSTRQLARRQRRWFARDERVNYLPATAPLSDVLRVLRDSRSYLSRVTRNARNPLALPARSTAQPGSRPQRGREQPRR